MSETQVQNGLCVPPLQERDIERIIGSVFAYAPQFDRSEEVAERIHETAAAVYRVLLGHADRDGQCDPAMRTIGTHIGKTHTVVQDAIYRLWQHRFIEVERRERPSKDFRMTGWPYRSNLYRLVPSSPESF